MITVTEKLLSGSTFLDEREAWSPGDRDPQYESVPGIRCACGEIIRPGAKVEKISGTLNGKSNFWIKCPNCGNAH